MRVGAAEVRAALDAAGGDVDAAAAALGVSRRTVYRRLEAAGAGEAGEGAPRGEAAAGEAPAAALGGGEGVEAQRGSGALGVAPKGAWRELGALSVAELVVRLRPEMRAPVHLGGWTAVLERAAQGEAVRALCGVGFQVGVLAT